MRFHTQTAGCTLTAQQPEVNMVRVAIQALAAVLGGTQSLHTNSMDEALALPSEKAVKLAVRTQQVIAHESGVINTIDPLGGSYYVEALTNRHGAGGLRILPPHRGAGRRDPGHRGRLLPAGDRRGLLPLPAGDRRAAAHHRRRQRVREEPLEITHPSDRSHRGGSSGGSVARLQQLRLERDNERVVANALAALQEAACRKENENRNALHDGGGEGLLPRSGEITRTLKAVWGTWQEPLIL
jgi:methylmalonyl-CoA mutase, N-terminal domain